MWIPSWLSEAYSKLHMRFGCELFTFQEARDFSSFNENKLAVAFSKLHSHRIPLIFEAEGVTGVRGGVYEGRLLGLQVRIIPTYHPAAALYNPKYKNALED